MDRRQASLYIAVNHMRTVCVFFRDAVLKGKSDQLYWQNFTSSCIRVCLQVQSCMPLCDPVDCSPQAPLSRGVPRQEYWSGLPFPPPGDLPDPGIELASLTPPALAGRFFTNSATWEVPSCILVKESLVGKLPRDRKRQERNLNPPTTTIFQATFRPPCLASQQANCNERT